MAKLGQFFVIRGMWEEETTDNKFIGWFLNTDLNLYWGVRRWFLNTDYTDYTVFLEGTRIRTLLGVRR